MIIYQFLALMKRELGDKEVRITGREIFRHEVTSTDSFVCPSVWPHVCMYVRSCMYVRMGVRYSAYRSTYYLTVRRELEAAPVVVGKCGKDQDRTVQLPDPRLLRAPSVKEN